MVTMPTHTRRSMQARIYVFALSAGLTTIALAAYHALSVFHA